jgi:hypothetical protein
MELETRLGEEIAEGVKVDALRSAKLARQTHAGVVVCLEDARIKVSTEQWAVPLIVCTWAE